MWILTSGCSSAKVLCWEVYSLSAVLMKSQTSASDPRPPFTSSCHCNGGHKVQELQPQVPRKVLEVR